MSRKLPKKKRPSLERGAAPQFPPGGALMYVPPQYAQSIAAQKYYGSPLKNAPAQCTSLFSPGVPLPPQPTVNPNGLPVQFHYPIGYNTFAPDPTLGDSELPS